MIIIRYYFVTSIYLREIKIFTKKFLKELYVSKIYMIINWNIFADSIFQREKKISIYFEITEVANDSKRYIMSLSENDRNDLLHMIYYDTAGFMNAKELYKMAIEMRGKGSVTDAQVKAWLAKQKVNQEHKRQKPYVGPDPHFNVDIPNDTHQADVMYLPSDYGFRYVLNVIDVATRFKASHPLKNITGSAVMNGFRYIYDNTLLDIPKKLMLDGGKEYNESVRELFEKEGTKVLIAIKSNHKDQALVERFNRTLAERLFKYMEYMENEKVAKAEKSIRVRDIGINYKKKDEAKFSNSSWYKHLPKIINQLNREETRMIGMSPIEAMKLHVKQPIDTKSNPDVVRYNMGDVVKYYLFGDPNC